MKKLLLIALLIVGCEEYAPTNHIHTDTGETFTDTLYIFNYDTLIVNHYDTTIVNNYVEENRGAFHLVDSHNGLVMNNTFVNITGAHSSLGSWGNSRNITWVGNTMNNVENYGFTLYGSEDSIIINNRFSAGLSSEMQ